MARKLKTATPVRQHDPHKPLLSKPTPPGASTQPSVAMGIELQAQRLIHKAGTADGAKSVIDAVAKRESASDFREDAFAVRWGFSSRAALMAASQPLFASEQSNWWTTQIPDGRWIVWSQDDLSARTAFPSLEAAREAVGDGDYKQNDDAKEAY
jgi:hypothetical protein